MNYVSDFYVICDEFSHSVWDGRLFTSEEEAKESIKDSPYKHLLYIAKLHDFFWQLQNKKISPRAKKAYVRAATSAA